MTEQEENALKMNILKIVKNQHEGFCQFRILHETHGFNYSMAYNLVHQLVEEGLIEYPKGNKDFLILSKAGKRAVEIGYVIYINEVEEKTKKLIQDEEEKRQLELNSLRFNNKYKWMIIISFFISFLSLLISFLTWYFPKK